MEKVSVWYRKLIKINLAFTFSTWCLWRITPQKQPLKQSYTLYPPYHYLSPPSGAFCVPWGVGGWGPKKEWIVGCTDPPNRGLFIEAVLQESYMNYFKMIVESSPFLHPLICWECSGKDRETVTPPPPHRFYIPKLPIIYYSWFKQGKIHLWFLNLKYEFRARKCILSKA